MSFNINPPPAPPPAPGKHEGALKDVETLAILLACSTKINPPPVGRIELLEIWEAKDDSVKVAYRLRARRLLRLWVGA